MRLRQGASFLTMLQAKQCCYYFALVVFVLGTWMLSIISSSSYNSSQLSNVLSITFQKERPPLYTWPNMSDVIAKHMETAVLEGKPLVPPFHDFESVYSVAPQFGLAVCTIKKAMSTMLSNVVCALFDDTFITSKHTVSDTWSLNYCGTRNELRRLSNVDVVMEGRKNYTKVVIVRNPITRFVSFFINKCIFEDDKYPTRKRCYACRKNMRCYLRIQYERFLRHASGNDNITATLEDRHAAPQSWNCEFENHIKEFNIIKLESDKVARREGLAQLLRILKKSGVPTTISTFVLTGALEGDTPHATHTGSDVLQVMRQVETDVVVQDYLRRIYFIDFLLFDFQLKFDAERLDQ